MAIKKLSDLLRQHSNKITSLTTPKNIDPITGIIGHHQRPWVDIRRESVSPSSGFVWGESTWGADKYSNKTSILALVYRIKEE